MFRLIEIGKIGSGHSGKGESTLSSKFGWEQNYQVTKNPSSRFVAPASSGRAGLNSPVLASSLPFRL